MNKKIGWRTERWRTRENRGADWRRIAAAGPTPPSSRRSSPRAASRRDPTKRRRRRRKQKTTEQKKTEKTRPDWSHRKTLNPFDGRPVAERRQWRHCRPIKIEDGSDESVGETESERRPALAFRSLEELSLSLSLSSHLSTVPLSFFLSSFLSLSLSLSLMVSFFLSLLFTRNVEDSRKPVLISHSSSSSFLFHVDGKDFSSRGNGRVFFKFSPFDWFDNPRSQKSPSGHYLVISSRFFFLFLHLLVAEKTRRHKKKK